MRTLTKPPKKEKQPKSTQPHNKRQNKKQSKKVIKTVFNNPFRYKIQTLTIEDSIQVTDFLLKYAQTLRSEIKPAIKPVKNQQFISFNPKQKLEKPPLVTQNLIFGIKQCMREIKKADNLLIVLFYEESKHETFEQLMCNILYHRTSYVLARDNELVRKELGVNRLLALGIRDEKVLNELSLYCCRCLIDIPWLVNSQWISLETQK